MWVLLIISLALGYGLARIMVQFTINEILANWKTNRCLPHILITANLFKPNEDPRTGGEFAADNFSFCTSEIAKAALTMSMKPMFDVFYKMMDSAIQSIGFTMNLRTLASNLFHGLNSIFDIFFRRFSTTIHELRVSFLKQMDALSKANGIAIGAVYAGIGVLRTIMNFFQLMMTIVIAGLVILIVLVIFLFFLLAPTIPLIISVIAIISATAMASSVGGMSDTFCFAPESQVIMYDGSLKSISGISIGDILQGGAKVTATMRFDTTDTELYNVNGIRVSGSHILYDLGGLPQLVKDSGHPISTEPLPKEVFCLNTSTHKIPVLGNGHTYVFADWEELDSADMNDWNMLISSKLGMKPTTNTELLDSETGVYEHLSVLTYEPYTGSEIYKQMSQILPGDYIADAEGWTRVTGIARIDASEVTAFGVLGSGANIVSTDSGQSWARCAESSIWRNGPPADYLISPFTESGTFKISNIVLRDFSDIGLSNIHETYSFTVSRLIQKCPV